VKHVVNNNLITSVLFTLLLGVAALELIVRY